MRTLTDSELDVVSGGWSLTGVTGIGNAWTVSLIASNSPAKACVGPISVAAEAAHLQTITSGPAASGGVLTV